VYSRTKRSSSRARPPPSDKGTPRRSLIEADSFRQAGDTFVVGVRLIGTGSESGLSAQDRAFHVWTFRGQKAIRLEFFSRESDALEAAGLSE